MLKYWIVRLRSYCDKICTRPAVVMVGKADRFSFVTKCESRIVLFRQYCRSPLLSELNVWFRTHATPREPCHESRREPHHASHATSHVRRLTARVNPTIYVPTTPLRARCVHRTVYSQTPRQVDRKGQPPGGTAAAGAVSGWGSRGRAAGGVAVGSSLVRSPQQPI